MQVIDQIRRKIPGAIGATHGRSVLINAVLGAIPIYTASVLAAPKCNLNPIDQILTVFGKAAKRRKNSIVFWNPDFDIGLRQGHQISIVSQMLRAKQNSF